MKFYAHDRNQRKSICTLIAHPSDAGYNYSAGIRTDILFYTILSVIITFVVHASHSETDKYFDILHKEISNSEV